MSSRNHTPISSNDYASIIWTWRLGEYLSSLLHLRIGAISIYQLSALFHVLVTTDLFFHLSEHLQSRRGRTLCLRVWGQQAKSVVFGIELPKRRSEIFLVEANFFLASIVFIRGSVVC
jgi:hypothetical protein